MLPGPVCLSGSPDTTGPAAGPIPGPMPSSWQAHDRPHGRFPDRSPLCSRHTSGSQSRPSALSGPARASDELCKGHAGAVHMQELYKDRRPATHPATQQTRHTTQYQYRQQSCHRQPGGGICLPGVSAHAASDSLAIRDCLPLPSAAILPSSALIMPRSISCIQEQA